jgi:ribosome-binding protein aMBF1 (putative translation factor)
MEEMECEAFNCSSKATTGVVLSVGHKGSISVYVCDECASYFGYKKGNTLSQVSRRDQSIPNIRTTPKEPLLNG